MKNRLYCLKVGSDDLNGIRTILDVINGLGKELDTLKSCGGDAYDRGSDTERISHSWNNLGNEEYCFDNSEDQAKKKTTQIYRLYKQFKDCRGRSAADGGGLNAEWLGAGNLGR